MRTVIVTLAILGAGGVTACRGSALIAFGLNEKALMSLRPRMSEEQLRDALGEPLSVVGRHSTGAEGKLFWWHYAVPSCASVGGVSFSCRGWSARATVLQGKVENVLVYDDGGTLVYECSDVACPHVLDHKALSRLPSARGIGE